jgi:hypothetical protein
MMGQELVPQFEKKIKELMDGSKETVPHKQEKYFITSRDQT